jgi:hypothetical protein
VYRHIALRTVVVVLPLACSARAAQTDLQSFVGTWRENQAKSRAVIPSALTYTFSAEPDGFISIVRGGVPLRDLVRIDGKEYTTPGVEGRTVSWTKLSDTLYESTIKRNGGLVATTRWALSDSGSRLRQDTTPVRANGDNDRNIIEYVRTAGEGNALLGVWKPVSTRSAVPDLFVVTLMDDELSVFYPKYGTIVYTMRLDGKRRAVTSANALPGTTTAAEPLSLRTLRRTTFQDGKATLETVMSVSADGKTLTVTTHTPGRSDEPSLFVYEKQD